MNTQPLRCPSHAVSRAWKEKREKQQHTMATGPYLDEDGYLLIVPSEWYNEIAAKFWRSHGFHWNNGHNTWERDIRLPQDGKRYSAETWLDRTRKQFYQFWPTLLCNCRQCHERFARTNQYETLCPSCRAQRNADHNKYFSY